MNNMQDMIEEYITSSAHLGKKHVHPRMLKMLEVGGMNTAFTRAEGPYLFDEDGTRYLDFLAGGGVYFLGRNHEAVHRACLEVLSMNLPNLCVVNASVLGGVVAEQLLELAGGHFTKCVFANSGAEANECAIRFSRFVTGRRRYLYLEGAFHGRTYGAISMCGWPQLKEGADPMMPICTPIKVNDLRQLRNELRKGDVAALFVEPVQGMTCDVLDESYLREAEILCEKYGTILVADEVQTGLGRTGHWFASTGAGARPGIITVSKTLSGGVAPVSACLISEEIYDAVYAKFTSGPIYFSTFAENNVSMAAALATIQTLKELDAPKRSMELSKQLRDGLADIQSRYDVIESIGGAGLMVMIHFKDSEQLGLKLQQKVLKTADSGAFAAAVNVDMYVKQHIIVQIPGPGTNAIKILPPVICTDEDIRYFLAAFEDTIASFYEDAGPVASISRGFVKEVMNSASKLVRPELIPPALAGYLSGESSAPQLTDGDS